MTELVVVACHGPDWIGQCRATLAEHPPDAGASWVFVDTSGTITNGADVSIQGGHPTGAYLWAVEQYAAFNRFLFIQDSMTVLTNPLPWFRDQWPGSGAVAWQRFPMQWDNDEQRAEVEDRYASRPSHGIFGPVFYTDRASLDVLAAEDLLPAIPQTRMQAQGSERAWAYAFADGGLPVVGPEWDPHALKAGDPRGPFRKVFANRP